MFAHFLIACSVDVKLESFFFRCFKKLKSVSLSLSLTGLKSEGLYRVSGFTEHIEDVKMAFDRGKLVLS